MQLQIEPREPLYQIMLARYYSSSLGRFMAVDPGDDTALEDPQSWNKYAYVRNNPINAMDPSGTAAETPFDIAMAVVSVGQAIAAPTPGNIAGAVLDVAAVIVPGAPAVGGRLIDAAQAGDKLADTAKGIKATQRGLASEGKVLAEKGLAKNTEKVVGAEGKAIPDALTKDELVEIKDSARVTDSKQLRVESEAAKKSGRQSTLVTGDKTKVSPKAAARFDKIERRKDLGPQK